MLGHMADKSLWPGCKSEEDVDCFDVKEHEMRLKRCKGGRLCSRAAHVHKKYEKIEEGDMGGYGGF